MFDYRAELQRRISQFQVFISSMNHRAHEVACGSCYMIFEERGPGETLEPAGKCKEPDRQLESLLGTFAELGLMEGTVVPTGFDLPKEGWREDATSDRFVQFSFERDCLHLDLPLQTLTRDEAAQIVRDRTGFFYLSDRPQFTLRGEDVRGYDPFRKVYVYGDEESAATDAAFILFQVWKFPIDSRFYVSAAAFGGKHTWEEGLPIE